MYVCNEGDQFQTEIRKTSSRCPRSVGDTELGHFTLLFEEDGKGIQRFLCTCSAIVLLIKPFVKSLDARLVTARTLLANCRNTVLVQLIAKTRKRRLVVHTALKTV